MLSEGSYEAVPVIARRAKRENGGRGRIPRTYDDLLTGPSDLDFQTRQLLSCTSGSAPSVARKRGSGGGSPRKYDDLLTGRSEERRLKRR
jgi:hypothetical protein